MEQRSGTPGPIRPEWLRLPGSKPDQQPQEIRVRDLATVKSLGELRRDLGAIRAAFTLVSGGKNRATATEIAEVACNEFDVFIEAYEAGQSCAQYGIRSVASHGRSRLVLDLGQLKEIGQRLARQIDAIEPVVEETLARFSEAGQRVEAMEERVREITRLQVRGRQLKEFMEKTRGIGHQVQQMEATAQQLQQQASQAKQLEQEVAALEERAKSASGLARRKQKLEERVKALEGGEKAVALSERDITRKEQELGQRIARLQVRKKWTDWGEVDEALGVARAELADLQQRLGEKRSLVGRLLGGGKST